MASESVNHGRAAQDCAHILDWLESAGEGFFIWEAFASKTTFAMIDGLFYNRPTVGDDIFVRDLEGVNKLLSIAIKDGFQPTKIARLLPATDPGHIPYDLMPYEFSVVKAHDVLLNWDLRYSMETYAQTIESGFLSGSDRPVEFYRQLLGQAIASNGRVNAYIGTEKIVKDDLQAATEANIDTLTTNVIKFYANDPSVSLSSVLQDIETLRASFSELAEFLLNTRINPPSGSPDPYVSEVKNSTPEIVYFKVSIGRCPRSKGGPILRQAKIEMLFNDSNRLEDVAFVDILTSQDGVNYSRLFLTPSDMQANASGYLSTTINLPFPLPGQHLFVRGVVIDHGGEMDSVDFMIQ